MKIYHFHNHINANLNVIRNKQYTFIDFYDWLELQPKKFSDTLNKKILQTQL